MEIGYHNQSKGQDIIWRSMFVLGFLFCVSCSTTKPFGLQDVSPRYKSFVGTDLDPYKEKPIELPVTNRKKYDDFIQEAQKVQTLLEFAETVALRADSKRTAGDTIQREMEASAYLLEDLPPIIDSLPRLIDTSQELLRDAPNDFDGPSIGTASRELGTLLNSLRELADKAPAITSTLQNIRQDSGNYAQTSIQESPAKNQTEPLVVENPTPIEEKKPVDKKVVNRVAIQRLNRKTKITGQLTNQIQEKVNKEEEEVLSEEEKKDREYTEQIRKGLVQVFQWEYFRNVGKLESLLANHPIPRVRSAAALALGRLKAGRLSLQKAIDRDGYQVRPSAYKGLADIGHKSSLSYFLEGVKSEDPEVVAVSYEGLGRTKDPLGREWILTKGLSSEYVIIVGGALRGLAYNKVSADVEVFDKFLKSTDNDIKQAAVEALAIHGTRESLKILERVVNAEPNLASFAIDELGKNPSLTATFSLVRLGESIEDEKLSKRISEALLQRKAFGRYAIILAEDDYLRKEPNERSAPISYLKSKDIGLVLGETKKEFAVRIGDKIVTDKYIQIKVESTIPGSASPYVSGWLFYPKLDIIEVKKLGSDEDPKVKTKKMKHSNLFDPVN